MKLSGFWRQHYMASQPTTPLHEISPPWKAK